jgi:hypothetical protein
LGVVLFGLGVYGRSGVPGIPTKECYQSRSSGAGVLGMFEVTGRQEECV